ncbi:MAG: hypothetical protein ACYTFI_00740 [Planctomycetota bacterium]
MPTSRRSEGRRRTRPAAVRGGAFLAAFALFAGGCSSKPVAPPPLTPEEALAKANKDLRETWEQFRDLLIKDVRDPKPYENLIDKPDGYEYLEKCLADGDDLIVRWLRMRREDLPRVKAEFLFYLDREECEISFTGVEDKEIPVLIARLIDGHWVIYPQRG